jgi:hypothetical protein
MENVTVSPNNLTTQQQTTIPSADFFLDALAAPRSHIFWQCSRFPVHRHDIPYPGFFGCFCALRRLAF